ncbi:MAG: D-glycero-alpha-D-manno-heptose-1,7-bisphosphate 7-phosphatase [Gemmatimonadota bacterium]
MSDTRRAAFVDRDGTIIREREYLSEPAAVELLPGAVAGLRSLQGAGYAVVVVTNQSGIARGLYGEAEYAAVAREVEARLEAAGIRVEGSYHCPHHPDLTGPCDCRKPATGLFRRAAREHGLALAASVYIGDRVRDVLPALELGGLGVLVRTGYGAGEADSAPAGVMVVDDLEAAAAAVTGARSRR